MNETKSALPAKIGGTEITRFNALRHGVLSRYTVLPWEDAAEYRDLVASLVAEHVDMHDRSLRSPLRLRKRVFKPVPVGGGLGQAQTALAP